MDYTGIQIGNQTNNSGLWWYILGYSGSYSITQNGNTIGALNSGVPAGIVPPGATLTGGNYFYGLQLDFKELGAIL